MSNDLVKTTTPELPANPFVAQRAEHVNAGTVEIESSRAVAEAQGKLLIAKKFPRDEASAYAAIMAACSRKSLADQAFYAYPKGGETITGVSIRLAEELARLWGNIDYGIVELSQTNGVSEMRAYCWDLQTNTMSSQNFTVRHERHKNEYVGGRKTGNQVVSALTDPRDVYELTANMAARRLRARILAVLPADLLEAAEEQLKRTLAGKSDEPIGDRIKKMLAAFAKFGVTKELIEKRSGKTIDEFFPEDVTELGQIFNSLRDLHTKPSDWFGLKEQGENTGLSNLTTPPLEQNTTK